MQFISHQLVIFYFRFYWEKEHERFARLDKVFTFAAAFTDNKFRRKKVQKRFASLKKVFTFAAALEKKDLGDRKKAKKGDKYFEKDL